MKRPGITSTLVGFDLLLALLLAALWLTPQGTLRGVHWPVPPAVAPQLGRADEVPLPAPAAVNDSRFLATLERPLFSPTRRPAPLSKPAQESAPSDAMGGARLLGLFEGAGDGGVIVLIDGKPRRVRLHEAVEGWQLTAVQPRGATFTRAGQERDLPLSRAALTGGDVTKPSVAPASPAPRAASPESPPAALATPPVKAAPAAPPGASRPGNKASSFSVGGSRPVKP